MDDVTYRVQPADLRVVLQTGRPAAAMSNRLSTPFLGVAVYVWLLALAAVDGGAHQAIRQSGLLDWVGVAIGVWTLGDAVRGGRGPRWPTHQIGWLLVGLCAWVGLSAAIAAVGGMWTPDCAYRVKQFALAAVIFFATSNGFGHRWHAAILALPVAAIVTLDAATEFKQLALDQNLAAFAVFTIPALVLAGTSVGTTAMWLVVVPGAIVLAGIAAATRNRGGGLGLATLAVVMGAQSRRRALWLGAFVVVLTLSFVALGDTGYFSRYRDIWTRGPAYDTVEDRLNLWTDGWRLGKANPVFGVGPGNYGRALGRRADPHNHLVAMFAETGMPGAALYAAFFLSALTVAARGGRNGAAGPVARASAAGISAFLVVGFFLGLQTVALAFVYTGLAQVAAHAARE